MDKSKAIDDLDMLPEDEREKLPSLESSIVFKVKDNFSLLDRFRMWKLKRACAKVKYVDSNFSMEIPEELK